MEEASASLVEPHPSWRRRPSQVPLEEQSIVITAALAVNNSVDKMSSLENIGDRVSDGGRRKNSNLKAGAVRQRKLCRSCQVLIPSSG